MEEELLDWGGPAPTASMARSWDWRRSYAERSSSSVGNRPWPSPRASASRRASARCSSFACGQESQNEAHRGAVDSRTISSTRR